MANSPTQTVGYPAVSRLEKTRHEIPLLSLDKTKSSGDLALFQGNHQVMLMLKLDGLTVKLTYENGLLMELPPEETGMRRNHYPQYPRHQRHTRADSLYGAAGSDRRGVYPPQ